ncbi:hypothetical protein MYCTH_2113028 [Thermothelomyces thermophilus ATCC 42464]|uniref:Uncharacterized protein n=1 Tax=Thermothelomyces thermophilus (strain ATCC 42464 / BCRC 31852 / DSM 1799) TaxID=573729 RepID=G2QM75_THET4|nr:uncharacterized protein MYCTH_2113028 [Thermothelomyces thermophilus ATCC 42464]AEO61055.1 hypothetical protein MYCTH_2113028 [Thermothelomyces thermophilus ATCC 42464]
MIHVNMTGASGPVTRKHSESTKTTAKEGQDVWFRRIAALIIDLSGSQHARDRSSWPHAFPVASRSAEKPGRSQELASGIQRASPLAHESEDHQIASCSAAEYGRGTSGDDAQHTYHASQNCATHNTCSMFRGREEWPDLKAIVDTVWFQLKRQGQLIAATASLPKLLKPAVAGIRFGATRNLISPPPLPQPTLLYSTEYVACKCSREQWVAAAAATVVLRAVCSGDEGTTLEPTANTPRKRPRSNPAFTTFMSHWIKTIGNESTPPAAGIDTREHTEVDIQSTFPPRPGL